LQNIHEYKLHRRKSIWNGNRVIIRMGVKEKKFRVNGEHANRGADAV
jgi:hypothetical protein